MGFWWDAFQQYQIGKQSSRSGTIEERVGALESDLDTAYDVMQQMAERIEQLEQIVLPANDDQQDQQDQTEDDASV